MSFTVEQKGYLKAVSAKPTPGLKKLRFGNGLCVLNRNRKMGVVERGVGFAEMAFR